MANVSLPFRVVKGCLDFNGAVIMPVSELIITRLFSKLRQMRSFANVFLTEISDNHRCVFKIKTY